MIHIFEIFYPIVNVRQSQFITRRQCCEQKKMCKRKMWRRINQHLSIPQSQRKMNDTTHESHTRTNRNFNLTFFRPCYLLSLKLYFICERIPNNRTTSIPQTHTKHWISLSNFNVSRFVLFFFRVSGCIRLYDIERTHIILLAFFRRYRTELV